MKTKLLIIAFAFFVALPGQAQRYITKNGIISFFSATDIENIDAENNQVNAVLDLSNGQLVFKVLMKSFEFEKALMQEHFNENYVESDKFPTATFSGVISNIAAFAKDYSGPFTTTIEGELTIHGKTQKIKETASLEWVENSIKGLAKFMVAPDDYDISIPSAVANKIAKEIEVSVEVSLTAI